MFSMEKEAAKHPHRAYACLQESNTLNYLSFLTRNKNTLLYHSSPQDPARKQKQFPQASVTLLTDRLKQVHGGLIDDLTQGALNGESQSVWLLATDSCKQDKLLVGESQNHGLLLSTLGQLFRKCYARQLEDLVTIKLSCWQLADGRLTDLLGHRCQWGNDLSEGKVVNGVPEIIIRNMKAALKVVKLFSVRSEEGREEGAQSNQTVVFTIKLEIDAGWDKQGNVTEYQLSKLTFVKLASPFTKSGKSSSWFISLYNSLQSQALQRGNVQGQKHEDDLGAYLRDGLIKGVSRVHCLTVISSTTSANDCLTLLKLGGYLQQVEGGQGRIQLSLPSLKQQQINLECQLLACWKQQVQWLKGEQGQALATMEQQQRSDMLQVLACSSKAMQIGNQLEFEYAKTLTEGCDKLEKYIFNEEIQDYYYAKKVVLNPSRSLTEKHLEVMALKKKLSDTQHGMLKRINIAVSLIRKESETKQSKYLINNNTKLKHLLQKLFEVYNTLILHFLYEESPMADTIRTEAASQPVTLIEQTPDDELAAATEEIIAKYREREREKERQQSPPPTAAPKQSKKRKVVDEMSFMFTNPNVGLTHKHYK